MDEPLRVIVVGAGLGGLGAAISIRMAGHQVLVLESAHELGEVGAGIQILPNASKILRYWGLEEKLSKYAASPAICNYFSWKGEALTSMNFTKAGEGYGSPFWDFHRANLHGCMVERAEELGAEIRVNSRVQDVEFGVTTSTVILANGERLTADLVVGADGIASRTRECFLGRNDPSTPTGDLAYRVLLKAADFAEDKDLEWILTTSQVNYWMGPDCHVVSYLLRGGELLNVVLLVPDDIPDGGAKTVEGNVKEMQDLFKDWTPRIGKLLAKCTSVQKWKLCIRHELPQWSHPSGTFTLLGDAVHATLPYLASGAGMSLEDGAVLGACLGRIRSKNELKTALRVYEASRRPRTSRIVQRGNVQQHLYHLYDGPEQEERNRQMRLVPTLPGDPLVWRDPELGPWLLGYDHLSDVERCWQQVMGPKQAEAKM